MKKEQFEILMYALYENNQLFIPQGQTIQEWIDNAFGQHCCAGLKDKTGYNNIDDIDPNSIEYINGNKKNI